jgi:thiol-disulfide isomerase/thioredoxin
VTRHLSAIAMACLLMAAVPAGAENIQAGMVAPPFTLETADGSDFAFPQDASGQATILFFWATWCPYCKAVMPYLQRIVEAYADYGVQVLAIDFKDDGDPVATMAELGYEFVVLPLGDLVAEEYGVWSAPGLLVVDGAGTVVYRRGPTHAPPGKAIAEVWDEQVRAALDVALGRTAEGP